MASTDAVVYIRPRMAASGSLARATDAVMFLPFRAVSGRFSAGLASQDTAGRKSWRPSRSVAFLDPDGSIAAPWYDYLRFLGEQKLGGADYSTLPDVANFITAGQAQSIANSVVTTALAAVVRANAQSQATLVQVVTTAALPGAAQIPPVVLFTESSGGGD